MKRILSAVVVSIFVLATTAVLAVDVTREKQMDPQINCCFQDGQCLKTREDNCSLKKGIKVTDCKDCPGVWGKGKK